MATFVGKVEQHDAPEWPTPTVLPATKYKGKDGRKSVRMISPFLSLNHDKPCPYCGVKMSKYGDVHGTCPTRDHVIPRSKGGKIIITVCGRCNNAKANMMPDEYVATLSGCRRTKTLIALIKVFIPLAAAEAASRKENFSTTAMEEAFRAANVGVA